MSCHFISSHVVLCYLAPPGTCKDTFSISEESWERMYATPPTSLVEKYYDTSAYKG